MAEIHPTAIVYEGTVLGEGVRVLEHAVVGKQPSLGARSTAKREPLRLECQHFLRLVAGEGDRAKVALDGARVVRALEMLTESLGG